MRWNALTAGLVCLGLFWCGATPAEANESAGAALKRVAKNMAKLMTECTNRVNII